MQAWQRNDGVVLLVVLFFALLLTSTVATFLKRATVDAMIARNREQAAQADALVRGGVRIAEALLLEDRLQEELTGLNLDTNLDLWSQLGSQPIPNEVGTLTLSIEDTGARLNLNALFQSDGEGGVEARGDNAEEFLTDMLERVIDGMEMDPGKKALYDPRSLAENLIDWVDNDEDGPQGGPEDDYYQRQEPRYRASNKPLLSVDELRLVQGFDGPLVKTLSSYVSVYPFVPGGCDIDAVGCGINVNTAPPHVLYLLYVDDLLDELRLADQDLVRDILQVREEGQSLCPEGQSDEACVPMSDLEVGEIFPKPTFRSEVFVVTAEASVGDVRRAVEAVLDRSQPPDVRLLSWRAR